MGFASHLAAWTAWRRLEADPALPWSKVFDRIGSDKRANGMDPDKPVTLEEMERIWLALTASSRARAAKDAE